MTDEPISLDPIPFKDAIALTQSLLDHLAQEPLAAIDLEQAIATLVSSETGARGFFVTYLSDPRPLADALSPPILNALRSSPVIVSELLVKNLAMSSAMAILHRRNQHDELAQGSERVRDRTLQLIETLHSPLVTEKAQKLHYSVVTGEGDYQPFLNRWGYDGEQRQIIRQMMEMVLRIAN